MFAYLAAFVTVVLALAVGDMIQSVHRLLRARASVRWSILVVLAALLVFQAILEEFFSLWRLAGIQRFTYYELLTLITPPVILSLAAMTVLPDEVPAKGVDLSDYYMATRRSLYLLLALWTLAVFVRLAGLFEGYSGRKGTLLDAIAVFPWQTLPLLALFALLSWSNRRWIQIAGLVALVILVNSAMGSRAIEIGNSRALPV